jgi:uroporphyrinogen decarboxylase
MNHRQRFALAMRHQPADRPPLDIGGTGLTGMRPGCQARLRTFLGFSGKPERMSNGIDERILTWANTGFRSVGAIVDLPSSHTRTLSASANIDCWGIRRDLIDGEWQITGSPLRDATLEDLRQFPWPEPRVDRGLLDQWEDRARELRQEDRYVVIAEHPVFGILELGCWMCGYSEFLLKMAMEPDFVRTFFDTVLQIQMKIIEQYYPVLAAYIDLTTSGDDFGAQGGPFMSPRMFKDLIAPYFSARIGRTKELAHCYFWHHSCGSVYALLDHLIDCGVDILNPVQTSAAQMQPEKLKERFGERVVFWGGVDVQQFLPKATPAQVAQEVIRLVDVLGAHGGYIMAPAHEMLVDIPPENIVAWVNAVLNKNN